MNVKVTLTNQEQAQILTDILESGVCGYWMESPVNAARRESDMLIMIAKFDAINKQGHKVGFTIAPNHIQLGIDRLLDPKFQVVDRVRKSIVTDNMDDETYDCIMQAICFNELLYG